MILQLLEQNHLNSSVFKDKYRWGSDSLRTPSFSTTPNAFPLVNVYAQSEACLVVAFLPGVDSENLEITVHDQILTIAGKKFQHPQSEGIELLRQEVLPGEFVRSLELPYRIDAEKVVAKNKNGVVEILLPRREEDKPKKISFTTL